MAVVAQVFVQNPQRAFSELELKSEVYRRIGELEACGAHVYIPRQDHDYAIGVGLRMLTLRRIVEEREGLYSASTGEARILAYYANAIAHFEGKMGKMGSE